MNNKNGGAAFPVAAGPGQQFTQGMSLRDWFAAKASEEDIQYQIRAMAPRNGFGEVMGNKVSRSAARYAHADDMLAERNKES